MAVQERVCVDCGAINQLSAATCWRCLQTMDEQPTAAQTPDATAVERRPA